MRDFEFVLFDSVCMSESGEEEKGEGGKDEIMWRWVEKLKEERE